jgi:hypothetical protein
MYDILKRIDRSEGSNLVYSQFKTVEGLGVFGIVLKANGYAEIKIKGSKVPYLSKKTRKSLKDPDQKRFILFTGDAGQHRTLILNIFNGNIDKLPSKIRPHFERYRKNGNKNGNICKVIGITGAGAEGISLKCCRAVHIMEPYWNNVRLEQIKGRAIRICSHKDLEPEDRYVDIYTYCTVFSRKQDKEHMISETIRNSDGLETSDENVLNISNKKDKINNGFLQIMKESAVDCTLNTADNKNISCMNIFGEMNTYLFDPNLAVDKKKTFMEFKQEQSVENTANKSAAPVIKLIPFKYKGVIYFAYQNDKESRQYDVYHEKSKDPHVSNVDYRVQIGQRKVQSIGTIIPDPIQIKNPNPALRFVGAQIIIGPM